METAKPIHRLSTVRRQQGVSLHEVAQGLRTPLDRVIWQEMETSDLLLSELWAWQGVLGVPIGNLLIDRHSPLQGPVIERSQIHHLVKIASHICVRAPSLSVQRLGERMIAQLLEIMSEEDL
jgi:hypothetical protein